MSIPPINPFAGMGAVQRTDDQRQIHQEREQYQDVQKQTSASETDAAAAATEASADRDADGRQAWHQSEAPPKEPTEDQSEVPENPSDHSAEPGRGIDHQRGNLLDLDG